MRAIPFIVGALLLAACATAARGPYAVIDGTEWTRTDPLSFPVRIASIDGKDYLDVQRRTVAPGRHVLRFESLKPLPRGRKYRDTRELAVDVAACTHYYFAARHAATLSEEWEIVELERRPLADCG